jgi:SAM-dependent methyltransferase
MPFPSGGLDQHYAVNPSDYFEHHDLEHKAISATDMLAVAEKISGGTGRILDIGAGRGELLKIAREKGWEAIGIEPSSTFAEYAATYSGAEVRRTPIEDAAFPENYFDAVIMAGVLEHLYQPDVTVREIARVLRPGGTLYVDVPNEAGLYFRVGNAYYKTRGQDWTVNLAPTFAPFHVFGFGAKSLRALLSKHRLAVREWRVYGGESYVPQAGGLVGQLERQAAKLVTSLSRYGNLGTYIETWAVRVDD